MDNKKICTRCGGEYPATRDYFSPVKEGHHGLHSICKTCRAQQARIAKQARPSVPPSAPPSFECGSPVYIRTTDASGTTYTPGWCLRINRRTARVLFIAHGRCVESNIAFEALDYRTVACMHDRLFAEYGGVR